MEHMTQVQRANEEENAVLNNFLDWMTDKDYIICCENKTGLYEVSEPNYTIVLLFQSEKE